MMRKQIIRVLSSKKVIDRIEKKVRNISCVGWSDFVKFDVLPDKLPKEEWQDFVEHKTGEIEALWYDNEMENVLLYGSIPVDVDSLKKMKVKIRVLKSEASLLSELMSFLKKRKLHWLEHAVEQYNRVDLEKLHPDAWLQQFVSLCGDSGRHVGITLLKQLRVISGAELSIAFRCDDEGDLGYKVKHSYFSDTEPGASSNNIKDTLEHMYRKVDIVEFDVSSMCDINADLVYIYEDGLWSGKELVTRLSNIKANACPDKSMRVRFRYAATSDAGIIAANSFLKQNNITNVFVESGRVAHYSFLKDPKKVMSELDAIELDLYDIKTTRTIIDKAIRPYAFKDSKLWGGDEKTNEAKEFCAEIGRQLIREKFSRDGKDITDDNVNNWCLGAYQYSSLTVFQKSVPKPVLPLLWLAGTVNYKGNEFLWKPLFSDIRRIE